MAVNLFLFNESYQVSDFLLRSDCEAFIDVTAQAGFNDVVEESMSCDGGDRAQRQLLRLMWMPMASWIYTLRTSCAGVLSVHIPLSLALSWRWDL